jgi:hypothetical protein
MKERSLLNATLYSCTQNSRLKKYMGSVHEGKKYLNQSHVCDSSFEEKGTLKVHKASVHEGKKPFHCNTCVASLAQNSNLNRNVTSVHEEKKLIKRPTISAYPPPPYIQTFLRLCLSFALPYPTYYVAALKLRYAASITGSISVE